MSVALAARSVILAGYLLAIGRSGRPDVVATVVAAALVVVWLLAFLRDRLREQRRLAAAARNA
jgi:hypothetical protein